jgi:enoyl-CoA hydratase/carnithine racemase
MSELTVTRENGVLEIQLHAPLLAVAVLEALDSTLMAIADDSTPWPVVIRGGHPTIFLAGAHLAEIANLDATSARGYARRGRAVIDRLSHHPAPVVASVHGSCSGGGFDLVLGCDSVVAGPTTTFQHPGAARGLVTGWGGTERLTARIGRRLATAVLLEGRKLAAADALTLGLVHEIDTEPTATARRRARELAVLSPERLATWRQLRDGRFVDRFRAVMVHRL